MGSSSSTPTKSTDPLVSPMSGPTCQYEGTVDGVMDKSCYGYIQYSVTSHCGWMQQQLEYSNPNFAEYRDKLKANSTHRFTVTASSGQRKIISVGPTLRHYITGKIDSILDDTGNLVTTNSTQKLTSWCEIIMEQRPFKIPENNNYVKLLIQGERVVSLPRHIPVQLQIYLESFPNRYAVEEVSVIK
jgi:hypothetical protein